MDMQCPDAQAQMTAYLARELTPVEEVPLEAHVSACERCEAELAAFRMTWEALGAIPSLAVGPSLDAAILSRLEWEATGARSFGWRPGLAVGAALVAALLSIGNSLLLPYERAFELCRAALQALIPLASMPDSLAFFVAGMFYGLIPLFFVAALAARWRGGLAMPHGAVASAAFAVILTPYVLIACSRLPGLFAAAVLGGVVAGAMVGGPGGWWLGRRALSLAPA